MKGTILTATFLAFALAGLCRPAMANHPIESTARIAPSDTATLPIASRLPVYRAPYPLTANLQLWLGQKVTAGDGAANDELGFSVAISGTTALVSAPFATINGNGQQGAVYVFTESNGTWSETQKLTASDGAASQEFGYSVVVSGTTAWIGAPLASVNGVAQGAVYVFTESNGAWSQTAKLAADDGAGGDWFGYSVAASGTRVLVGAIYATVNDNPAEGAAYLFDESDGAWSQAAKLTANDGVSNDGFGWSVALDDTTAVVGASAPSPRSGLSGAAYVFADADGTWTQIQKLVASDGAIGDNFGWSVAVHGANALVGAPLANVNGTPQQGAAYLFTDADGTWTQVQKISAGEGATGDAFGRAVTLEATTALVGAPFFNAGQGAAYLFTDSGGNWTQTQTFTATDSAAGNTFLFGGAVALSGTTADIGAFGSTVNGNSSQGAAYFYGASDLGLTVSAPQTVNQGQTYVSETIATNNASAASPAVSATITVPAAASFVSATATQGSCSEDAGVVTCDFGQINGNAGTATANVTLKATGNVGDTIENTASIAQATPPLTASAATTISEGGTCPRGYTEHDGNPNAGKRTHSPIYQAPAGVENAILTAPSGFQLYAVFQNAEGRKIYRIPGNEVHRQAPAGTFTWVVKAGNTGGAYTLCVLHP